MKLLFLDIDGVLNSKRSNQVYGEEKVIENLDPIAIGLIHDIVKKTSCIICLSSDWKLHHDYMELGKQLHLPIMFQTPDYSEYPRSSEILTVISGIKPESYAILDDIEDNNEFKGMNFVKVNSDDGVSYENFLDVVSLLNK